MKPGQLIAVEGADKAGKHTQVAKIIEYLRANGVAAETLDFPQYKAYWGKFVKDYLNGNFGEIRNLPAEYTMLPYALDRQAHMPKIQKWLDSGKWVVLDRYAYSNAFSVAKCTPELWQSKIDYLEDMEFNQLGIRRPDHNIYLYLDPQIAFGMRNQGLKEYQNGQPDIHERDYDLLHNVSKVYHKIARRDPANWTVVDEMKPDNTRMTIDEVFCALRPVIDKLLLHAGIGK